MRRSCKIVIGGTLPNLGFAAVWRTTVPAGFLVAFCAVFLLAFLVGCPTLPHEPGIRPPATSLGEHEPPTPPHEGRPYDVVSGASLLTILVFRSGPLARLGHNHVIASHEVTGAIYVPGDLMRSTFELHVPVAGLTIDEPSLRSEQGSDFPPDVPDTAREGTRRNMLSEALLDGARYPDITLVCERLEVQKDGLAAHVRVTVRDQVRSLIVPMQYRFEQDTLTVTGSLPIRQTDLGLTPFNAMLGALQVQDELLVRFRIVARAAHTR